MGQCWFLVAAKTTFSKFSYLGNLFSKFLSTIFISIIPFLFFRIEEMTTEFVRLGELNARTFYFDDEEIECNSTFPSQNNDTPPPATVLLKSNRREPGTPPLVQLAGHNYLFQYLAAPIARSNQNELNIWTLHKDIMEEAYYQDSAQEEQQGEESMEVGSLSFLRVLILTYQWLRLCFRVFICTQRRQMWTVGRFVGRGILTTLSVPFYHFSFVAVALTPLEELFLAPFYCISVCIYHFIHRPYPSCRLSAAWAHCLRNSIMTGISSFWKFKRELHHI